MNKYGQMEMLRDVWLFEHCSRSELAFVAAAASRVEVPAGKVLAREGEPGREFFVIIAGEAEAARNGVRVASLGAGDFFGEMTLLDRQPRAATVTASAPSELLVLTDPAFHHIIETIPTVACKMLVVLTARLRDFEDRYLPVERHAPTLRRLSDLDLRDIADDPIDRASASS
jgi:CRP/FNR family cyclic AMP-dependent transcriptional regulator